MVGPRRWDRCAGGSGSRGSDNMQTKPARLVLVASLVLVTAVAVAALAIHFTSAKSKIHLTVHVVHLLDESIVTGTTVVAVSGSEHVVARELLDSEGMAILRLDAGSYIVRMASGYTGQVEVDLESEREVTLKVIPVLR